MKCIGSGARHNRDLRSGRASKLRSKRRRLNTEFVEGVHGYEAVGPAAGAERWQRPARALHHGKVARDSEVAADAIHGEVVRVRPLSVYAELSLVVESSGRHYHAWRQRNQRLETPAVERKILDERAVDYGAHDPR